MELTSDPGPRPRGRLSLAFESAVMPTFAPLFARSSRGWAYRDSSMVSMHYETLLDPVLDMLPPDLTPTHDPPQVQITALECRTGELGDFNEMKIDLLVDLDGAPHRYCPLIIAGALPGRTAPDAAIALGRELIGAPKKAGRVRVQRDAGQITASVERPVGRGLASLTVTLKEQTTSQELGLPDEQVVLFLRVIPRVDSAAPSVAELVRFRIPVRFSADTVYRCEGIVSFGPESTEDPWARLPAVRVLGAIAARYSQDIPPYGEVIKDYLRPPDTRSKGQEREC